jgi:hypothetical protein
MSANPLTIRAMQAIIARLTAKRYQINWDRLDEADLREVIRLLRDLEYESQARVRKAQQVPIWRRP